VARLELGRKDAAELQTSPPTRSFPPEVSCAVVTKLS